MEKNDLDYARKISRMLLENLPLLSDAAKKLNKIPNRTPNEEKLLKEVANIIELLLPYTCAAGEFMNDYLGRQVMTYYYQIKELAIDGDAKAFDILHDLKPLFEKYLQKQMCKN